MANQANEGADYDSDIDRIIAMSSLAKANKTIINQEGDSTSSGSDDSDIRNILNMPCAEKMPMPIPMLGEKHMPSKKHILINKKPVYSTTLISLNHLNIQNSDQQYISIPPLAPLGPQPGPSRVQNAISRKDNDAVAKAWFSDYSSPSEPSVDIRRNNSRFETRHRSSTSRSSSPASNNGSDFIGSSESDSAHSHLLAKNAIRLNLPRSEQELFIDTKLADPRIWASACQSLGSAKPGNHLDHAVIEIYLLKSWYMSIQPQMPSQRYSYYLDSETVSRVIREEEDILSTEIHKTLLLPPHVAIPKKPVLFFPPLSWQSSATQRLALFDYQQEKVLVFSHGAPLETNMYSDWTEWNGNYYWRAIANVFGWILGSELDERGPQVIEPNWNTSEADTGSWMASLCQEIFDNGWMYSTDINQHPLAPKLQCVHAMRERIFLTALQTVQKSYDFWNKTQTLLRYSMEPNSEVVNDMKAGLLKFKRFEVIALALATARMKCHLLDSHDKDGNASNDDNNHNDDDNDNDNDDNDDDSIVINLPPQPSRRSLPEIQLPEVELNGNGGEEALATSVDERPFDDYESAMLVCSEDQADIIPNTWTFDTNGMLVLGKHWSIWRDRGYRLQADFFSMFNNQEPVLLNDHLLPHWDSSDQASGCLPSSPVAYPSSLSSHSSEVLNSLPAMDNPDVTVMGAQDMLDEAGGVEGTSESQGVFVKGKARNNKFIYFDLEKDRVNLDDEEVSVSVDIDSVIWVTHKPQFIGPINIHLLPLLDDKPPFSINNHVYVQVLQPPTTRNPRQRSKRYPLSALPHTHFGQMGQGSGQFNTYVFFPRMIRKDPGTHRMTTLMPREVQELWFSQVIMPALPVVLANYTGIMEYLPTSVSNLQWKIGTRRTTKTIPLTPEAFSSMRTTLCDIINNQPDLLGRFGSFFFVVDARGIKLLSKQHHPTENIYQALCSMIPNMDWDYMKDRSHGELLLDLGISYHPPSREDQEPLVGLWRLDRIDDSYDLMGMKKGMTHYTAMFGAYGGRQAETKLKKSRLVHLCFRSSYNLCFEVVRLPGQTNYLCDDCDAVKTNDRFMTSCDHWKKLFQSSQIQSFGVREEVRGSGLAIIKLLDVASEKAQDYMSSDPIIWIKSSLFFKLLARRLAEFQNVQLHLSRNRPSNYGMMATLIIHLIKHTMVTPRIKHTFLNDVLRDLRFSSIMWRFGMFFLHDLKLKKGVLSLRELPEEDPAEVIQAYGQSLKKPQATQANQPYHLIQMYQQDACPWGPDPSWSRIQKLLETEPEIFLREWRLDDDWEAPELLYTKLLFVEFTHQLWLSLAEQFASAGVLPKPTTVQEAMETWTVPAIQHIIGIDHCRFLPSSCGLKGKLPLSHSHDLSFSARRATFFPEQTIQIPENSVWKPYTQPGGYISTYHQYLVDWDMDEGDQLCRELDNIFGQLQCLPVGGLSNKKGKQVIWGMKSGKINFISNSKFYRIEEIGKEVAARPRTQVLKRPHASKNILQRRLDETLGRSIKPPIRSRKSAKIYQKRKPPVRRKADNNPSGSESGKEQQVRVTRSKAKAAQKDEGRKGVSGVRITRSRMNAARKDAEREDSGSGRHIVGRSQSRVKAARERADLESDSDSDSLEYTDEPGSEQSSS